MGTPDKLKGPHWRCEPWGKQTKTTPQSYDELRQDAAKLFPSWELDQLREIVVGIRLMASPEHVVPGVTDSACAYLPGAGVLYVHFDGKGGVMIDPESDETHALFELGRALKLVLGDQVTVGKPKGCAQ